MSREHLYKAKRVNWREPPKEKWWVEGNLLISDENYYIVPDFGVSCAEKLNNYVCDKLITLHAFEVDKETVCEYTGLQDKNGKQIFEGDIVKLILPNGEIRHFKASIKNVVRKVLCHPDFDDEVSRVEITGIVFEWNGYELFPCVDTYGVPDYKMMEVIGNIFDNAELLEELEEQIHDTECVQR